MLRPAALLVATLLLTGCVPGDPVITPAPEPSGTPIFSSDEEALAAATDAYAKYLEVSDAITAEGGVGVDRLLTLVTDKQYMNELAAFNEFSTGELHTSGVSVVDVISLQSYSAEADGTPAIVIYVCVDVSGVRVLNASDQDVTTPNRPDKYPLEVEFEANSDLPSILKMSRSEKWSGKDFCQQ